MGENMLLGQTTISLDDKKRLTIPGKYRNDFTSNTVVVSRGFENCLVIRTIEEFLKWQNKILLQSEGLKETRILARQIFANSEELTFDSKGRVKITPNLLSIAEIENRVVVIGMSNKLELWSEKSWKKFDDETKNNLEEAVATLKDF